MTLLEVQFGGYPRSRSGRTTGERNRSMLSHAGTSSANAANSAESNPHFSEPVSLIRSG